VKNGLAPVVVVLAVCGMVLSLVICWTEVRAFVSDRARVDPPPPFSWLTGTASTAGAPVTGDDVVITIGSGLLLALGTLTVALSRGAIRSERARRGLNVVWDVVAFWPRSVHPFVPPPYAQQVVPGLVRRLAWHLGTPCLLNDPEVGAGPAVNPDPARRVVLAAHSQGSLISLVALLWLRAEDRERVGWVTFGSQLRLQFPRAFPHYVRVSDLRDALGRHRWVSLFRETDPIAGPVTSWGRSPDGPTPHSYRLAAPEQLVDDWVDPLTGRRVCGQEWRLLDPPATDLGMELAAVDRIRGHGEYWCDPDWPLALAVARGDVPHGEVTWAAVRDAAAPRRERAAGE
jgi:hypothetical protein